MLAKSSSSPDPVNSPSSGLSSRAAGTDVHHMFADHAAIVPRRHAHGFFVGIGERLDACRRGAASLPPTHTEPEAFIVHTLLALGAPSTSVGWLAPLVVSIDGRMAKWCARYHRLHVQDIAELGGSLAACSDAMLHTGGRWAEIAARSARSRDGQSHLTPTELRRDACAARGPPIANATDMWLAAIASPQPRAFAAAVPARATCTWPNGCCLRHPRIAACLRGIGRKPNGSD